MSDDQERSSTPTDNVRLAGRRVSMRFLRMTLAEAEDLATRALAAIDAETADFGWFGKVTRAADRERVASDLAGLRVHLGEHYGMTCCTTPCADARRYADGLRRTADLYGVTP